MGPTGQPETWRWILFTAALLLATAAALLVYRTPSSRLFFGAIMAIAVIDVASLAFSGVQF